MITQFDLFSGVSDTSKQAYVEITIDGTRQTVRQRILDIITCFPKLSRNDISRQFNISLQSVCGRVNELIRDGEIKETGTKIDEHSNKTVCYLELNENK